MRDVLGNTQGGYVVNDGTSSQIYNYQTPGLLAASNTANLYLNPPLRTPFQSSNPTSEQYLSPPVC